MLCNNKATAIFCIFDNIFKEIYPVEDKRQKIGDGEGVFTAVSVVKIFYGNHNSVILFSKRL